MTTSNRQTKPWFRQFWPWFLVILPSSAVIASMVTITLAVNHAPVITSKHIGKFAQESVAQDK